MTLRENVLFGQPMDRLWYEEVSFNDFKNFEISQMFNDLKHEVYFSKNYSCITY